MSISKRQSHIVYDKYEHEYYFILPDGSDRRIPYVNWVENIDWQTIYSNLYELILNKDPRVKDINNMEVREICQLFNVIL